MYNRLITPKLRMLQLYILNEYVALSPKVRKKKKKGFGSAEKAERCLI